MLIVVNYHYVRPTFDAPYSGIHGITPDQFEAQLRLLGTAGTFVGGDQIRDAIKGRSGLPARAILVTFDDGLREQFEHALPVLQRLGVPALFFVNTHPIAHGTISTVHKIHLLRAYAPPQRFRDLLEGAARARGVPLECRAPDATVARQYWYDTPEDARLKYVLNFQLEHEDRDLLVGASFSAVFPGQEAMMATALYMDVTQLRKLAEWRFVGSHGHDHVPLAQLSRADVVHGVGVSLDLLEAWLAYRPYAFSYPYGACGRHAGPGAAEAGIEFGFTTEPAGNSDLSRPLYLARLDCNEAPGGKRARLRTGELFDRVAEAGWHQSEVTVGEPGLAST